MSWYKNPDVIVPVFVVTLLLSAFTYVGYTMWARGCAERENIACDVTVCLDERVHFCAEYEHRTTCTRCVKRNGDE